MNNLSDIGDVDFYTEEILALPVKFSEQKFMGALPDFLIDKKNLIYLGIGFLLLYFALKSKYKK